MLHPNFVILGAVIVFLGGLSYLISTIQGRIKPIGILADGLAAVPTLVKSYIYPGTENYHTYLASAIGAAITLLTISNWNFANFGFPLYILIICIIFVFLIKFQAGKFIIELKNNTKKC